MAHMSISYFENYAKFQVSTLNHTREILMSIFTQIIKKDETARTYNTSVVYVWAVYEALKIMTKNETIKNVTINTAALDLSHIFQNFYLFIILIFLVLHVVLFW